MPKAGKNDRRGRIEPAPIGKRELIFREDGQGVWAVKAGKYARVVKMLGNSRLEAQCFDGKKRLAHIRGSMRKTVRIEMSKILLSSSSTHSQRGLFFQVWIHQGDIILLSLRHFQDDRADVIDQYTPEEARLLRSYGELPDNARINETDTFNEEDGECMIEFADEAELDIDGI
ncbi:hypothetical protein Clacol_002322 [Clathrus columnatus]|uniref:Eukaryotic translation initiation factor 4C n=1 Tax=Clathrus columnatus TaxID=1419009 RepID=A0AAV5A0J1_9AGAM|nr:hypothetical protein Clacol_002322 [Clathrus columnatus]